MLTLYTHTHYFIYNVYNCFNTIWLKKTSPSNCLYLSFCQRPVKFSFVCLLHLPILSHGTTCLFLCHIMLFGLYDFTVRLHLRQYKSNLVLCQCCLVYTKSTVFPRNRLKQFVDIYKISCCGFDWNCVESVDQDGND